MKKPLTQDRLKELLEYREDGNFTWKVSTKNQIKIGDIAGSIDKQMGYKVIRLDGRTYPASHLVWLWHKGKFPKGVIRHIDGNKLNTRIENLNFSHEERKKNKFLLERVKELLEYREDGNLFGNLESLKAK